MGLFQNAFFFAGVVYAFLQHRELIVYFFAFVGVYTCLHILTPAGRSNPLRRKIMFSTWKRAEEGNILVKLEMDCTKVNEYLASIAKETRPTLTHVAVKALAQVLANARETLNGKLIFDRFVPYETVAVTMLVDINEGEDLATLTIDKADTMRITDICDYARSRAVNIKRNKGDKEHKQRIGLARILPPFLIRLALSITQWVTINLGLDVAPLGMRRNTFGGGVVTSLGMLGIKDAYVPFTPFMNVPVILAVGQVTDKPIVKDGKIVVAPILNINATIDHRFIDGGRCKRLLNAITDVFENPQKY